MDHDLTPEQLLVRWRSRVRMNQRVHYVMEERAARRAFWFGVASALLSGSVGLLILVAARYDLPVWLRVLTGGVSMLASVIAAVTTSAKWSEKAAQHHSVAAAYGAVLRKIEASLVIPRGSPEQYTGLLDDLRVLMDDIPANAPPVPERIWKTLSPALTPTAEHPVRPGASTGQSGA